MYAPQIIFLSPPPIHVDLCGLNNKTPKNQQPNKNEAAAATLFFLKL
jgi:hypothetical protein